MTQSQFEEGTTLDRFLMDNLREHPEATGQFVNLIQSVSLAAKMISARVNRAGLAGLLGETGGTNVHGEFVQKLDETSNEIFLRALEHRGHTCMVVSEEEGGIVRVPAKWHSGRYVVTLDPLDGSSNIDCNATIGSIFGVFLRESPEGQQAISTDVLRSGRDLVAAGYVLYGAGTVLVLALPDGVFGFTLDPQVGEFFLSHPQMKIPDEGTIYSVNESYWSEWQPGVREFIQELRKGERTYSARYIGSLVADFHRNMIKGGVFLYPGTVKHPQGKLRLLYEAFPLAFIIEKAGGSATNGRQPILDLWPRDLHDRTPLVIGSRTEVQRATALMTTLSTDEDDDPLLLSSAAETSSAVLS